MPAQPKLKLGWLWREHPDVTWISLGLGGFTALLCWAQATHRPLPIQFGLELHSLLGFVVSLLLVFRTNSAYERWWEARKLLGSMNNHSRHLSAKLRAYAQLGKDDAGQLAAWMCAFLWSVKEAMRGPDHAFSATLVPVDKRADYVRSEHKPLFLLNRLADFNARLAREKRLEEGPLINVEASVMGVTDAFGGLERIKNTPIPASYTVHLHRIILVYVFTLPFALVPKMAWISIPVVMLIYSVMAGIEAIGQEIEEPFGRSENDLPVSDIIGRMANSVCLLLEVPNPADQSPLAATGAIYVGKPNEKRPVQ